MIWGEGIWNSGGTSSSNPIAQWILTTDGIVPARMFLGDSLTDRLSATTLAALNAPEFGVDQTKTNISSLMTKSFRTDLLAEGWQVADTSYGNVGLESLSVDVLFRTSADGFPASAGGLAGKREIPGPNTGREIVLETTGRLTVNAKDASTSSFLQFNQYNASGNGYADGKWHVIIMRINRSSGLLEAATEHEDVMSTSLPSGSVDTATPWSIGRVRGVAFPGEIAYVVECEGIQCEADNLFDRAKRLALETTSVLTFDHR